MAITSAQFVSPTIIQVITDDGQTFYVPNDPRNRHYQDLLASGVPIAPYVTPPSVLPPITMMQFRRAVRAAGRTPQVVAAINALTPDMQDAWQFARLIPRDADFLAALAAQMTLTPAQVDNFFTQAGTFPPD